MDTVDNFNQPADLAQHWVAYFKSALEKYPELHFEL